MRKIYNKYSLIFIFMIMTISMTVNITYADSALLQGDEDNPSSWAKVEIDKAIDAGLVPKRIQGEYRSNITREEFSEVVVNLYEALSGKEAVLQEENPFTDTQNTKVRIANDLGIVAGIGDGKFAPDNAITRQEISVMLYRTLKAAKPGYGYSGSYGHIFADYDIISEWAQEAIGYLYDMGVVSGISDNLFSPKENTSREQAIVFANRMYEMVLASKSDLIESSDGTSNGESDLKLKLEELISQEMGKPYQRGGTGPDGYDCSGLVYSLYGKLDISLPRTASSQAEVGTYVPKEELTFGDLVFFAEDGENISHVGIYVGDGEFVHAPQTGDVVKKSTLTLDYFSKSYYTARRVINQNL